MRLHALAEAEQKLATHLQRLADVEKQVWTLCLYKMKAFLDISPGFAH